MARRASRAAIFRQKEVEGVDPYFSLVVMLLHMDGANASTTFTDSSLQANVMTAVNGASISTTTPKFGSGCGLFATGMYVTAASNAAFSVMSGDFTVEAWVKPNSLSTTRVIAATRPSGGDRGWMFYMNASGQLSLVCWDASAASFAVMSAGSALSTAAYQHVAFTKFGNVFTLWINGASVATTTTATALGASSSFTVSRDLTTAGREWDGRIDELRYTVGIARYTSAFTPPTLPFYSP